MNAYEYRKTLSPKQAEAFHKLLESKLWEGGYYSKNVAYSNKVMELYRQAKVEIQDEFDAVEKQYNEARKRIQDEIEALQAKSRSLFEAYEALNQDLHAKTGEMVRDEITALDAERGDASAERAIIEQLAIAEYSKRLAKKNKEVA